MASSKRWSFRKVFTANGSCGGCGRKAGTDIDEPKSKFKSSSSSSDPKKSHRSDSSSAGSDDCCNSASENHHRGGVNCSETTARIHNSLPVVKASDDPYSDFRQSMIQMIFENEIYRGDDLQHLLHCFLELNSPHHHEVIVKAFLEICNSAGEDSTTPCSSADTASN